jgi:transposase
MPSAAASLAPARPASASCLLSRPDTLTEDERAQLASTQDTCPHLDALAAPVRSFAEIMTRRRGQQDLEGWLTAIEADDQPELHSFANGIRRDQHAVTAGLTLPYSSAAVEGNVNRIFKDDQTPDVRPGRLRPAPQ